MSHAQKDRIGAEAGFPPSRGRRILLGVGGRGNGKGEKKEAEPQHWTAVHLVQFLGETHVNGSPSRGRHMVDSCWLSVMWLEQEEKEIQRQPAHRGTRSH